MCVCVGGGGALQCGVCDGDNKRAGHRKRSTVPPHRAKGAIHHQETETSNVKCVTKRTCHMSATCSSFGLECYNCGKVQEGTLTSGVSIAGLGTCKCGIT